MFRAIFSPIIRSTGLYLQYLVVFTQVAAGWCLGWVETVVGWGSLSAPKRSSKVRITDRGANYSCRSPAMFSFYSWREGRLETLGSTTDNRLFVSPVVIGEWVLVEWRLTGDNKSWRPVKPAPVPPDLGVIVGCEGQRSSRKFGVRETAVMLATVRVACSVRAKNT
jgi:hypothetical protein